MIARQFNKIPRLTSSIFNDTNMYFHKNRMYSNKKCNSDKICKDNVSWGTKMNKKCQGKWDNAQMKKKPKFWSAFFGSNQNNLPYCAPPDKKQTDNDPDLSMFGGQPYGTCGDAYVIKIENVGEIEEIEFDKETQIIREIEAPLHLKNVINDPMPTFRSAEQRLLDLSDRKLHPLYDKLRLMKKKPEPQPKLKHPEYKFFTGPMKTDEIPIQIQFNKELLESKHMFSEYKTVEPPKQIVGRLIELKKNERKYDEKPNVFFRDEKPSPKRNVYDSVFQHPLL